MLLKMTVMHIGIWRAVDVYVVTPSRNKVVSVAAVVDSHRRRRRRCRQFGSMTAATAAKTRSTQSMLTKIRVAATQTTILIEEYRCSLKSFWIFIFAASLNALSALNPFFLVTFCFCSIKNKVKFESYERTW